MHASPEVGIVLIVCVTLAIGAALRTYAERFRVPYTIAMLLVGLGIGLIAARFGPGGGAEAEGLISLLSTAGSASPDLIILIFLPVLVFESAFALEAHALQKNLGAVVVLAGPALLLSTGAVGAMMVGLAALPGFPLRWGWLEALVFGALISATDPVAVVGLLREVGAPKRLGLLIEGESLLNDGTAIVVFSVLLGLLTGGAELSAGGTLLDFVWVTAGGLGVGLALAVMASEWLSRTFNAPLVEITLTVVLAYSAMFLAEELLHVSGVMAVVAAGVWMSGRGRVHISPEVSHFLRRFWEMLSYLANTLIFFLVGFVIATRTPVARTPGLLLIGVTFIGIVLIRFGLLGLFRPLLSRVSDPISGGEATVIAWGGLRGAVALALALVASQHPQVDAAFGDQTLTLTAGVVFLTILVNGSTMRWLLRQLGFDRPPPADRLIELMSETAVLSEVGEQIDGIAHANHLRTVNWTVVEQDLAARESSLQSQIDAAREELDTADPAERDRGRWRQALNIERQSFWHAFAQGTLSGQATRILDHEIDIQFDRLARGAAKPDHRPARDVPGWRHRLADLFAKPGRRFGRIRFETLFLRYELFRGAQLAAEEVIHSMVDVTQMERDIHAEILSTYRHYLHESKERLEDLRANLPEVTRAVETRLARRIQLNLERDRYRQLGRSGAIDPSRLVEALADVERRMKMLTRGARRIALPKTGDLCRHTPLFEGLDAVAIQQVAGLTVEKVFAPGDILFRQGDQGESMFIIARGAVAVIREPAEVGVGEPYPKAPGAQPEGAVPVERGAESVTLHVLGGGEILGEMALLTHAPRIATAQAVTTVTVGEITRTDFERLMQEQPRLRDAVWSSLAERRFDNCLRDMPAYESLDRKGRIRWFRRGRLIELEPGAPVPMDGAELAFVVTGALESDSSRHPEMTLLWLEDAPPLRALERSWVALLPGSLGPAQAPPASETRQRPDPSLPI